MNGDYHLMNSENESNNHDDKQIVEKFDSPEDEDNKDLPF
jgi:hypothetical protein